MLLESILSIVNPLIMDQKDATWTLHTQIFILFPKLCYFYRVWTIRWL